MATNVWTGVAPPFQARYGSAVASQVAGDVIAFRLNGNLIGPKLVIGAGPETAAAIYTRLADMYAAGPPEFAAFTWEATATRITARGPADGRTPLLELVVLLSSGTLAADDAQGTNDLGTGPSHWNNSANWSLGVPVATQDLVFGGGAPPLYEFPGSGTAFASVTFRPESAGAGLPATNAGGFPEYMDRRLSLQCGNVTVNTSAPVYFDLATSTARIVTVEAPSVGSVGLDLTTTTASAGHTLRLVKGRVTVADGQDETAEVITVVVSPDAANVLTLGAGNANLANVTQEDGTAYLKCAISGTWTKKAGTLTRTGSGTAGTIVNRAGLVTDTGTGTITAADNRGTWVYAGLGATYTTTTLNPYSYFYDEAALLTYTNLVLSGCHLAGGPSRPGTLPTWFNPGVGRTVSVT